MGTAAAPPKLNLAGTFLFQLNDPTVNPPSVRVGIATINADGKTGSASYSYYPTDGAQPIDIQQDPTIVGMGRIQFHGHQDVEKFPDFMFVYATNGNDWVGQNMPDSDNATMTMTRIS